MKTKVAKRHAPRKHYTSEDLVESAYAEPEENDHE
jgi:hypothetical protein